VSSYHTLGGEEVTREEIEAAVRENRAIIHWSHGDWCNVGGLAIYVDEDEADVYDQDTRGECWSMADECWTTRHPSVRDARRAAAGNLRVS